MGVINIPPNEQDALRRTDTEALRALIEQCLRDECRDLPSDMLPASQQRRSEE